MPEVTISVGGRDFAVACQEGEEAYLQTAAKMLDDEAQVLVSQVGRMPEARMLLMAGLMLADKTASMEDQVAQLKGQIESGGTGRAPAPGASERIEVPVVPQAIIDRMAELAARAEALAVQVEEQAKA